MTRTCNIGRRANGKMVHPWLIRGENSANRVQVDNHEDLFGRHPNDSVGVISDEDLASDQSENPSQGLTACHVFSVLMRTITAWTMNPGSSLASRQDP